MAFVCSVRTSPQCKGRWGKSSLPDEAQVCHACARDLRMRGMSAAGYPRPLAQLASEALSRGVIAALSGRGRSR